MEATTTLTVTQTIELILAPGVMINACGLLLLGISNKFSNVLNRIRALTDEQRRLAERSAKGELTLIERQRVESIARQVKGLLSRARFIRNAVFCYFCGVGLFVGTSLLIGADFFIRLTNLRDVIIAVFLLGMVVVFIGVIFGVRDTFKGFDVVRLEVKVDE